MKIHQHGAKIFDKMFSFEVSIGSLPLILIISSKNPFYKSVVKIHQYRAEMFNKTCSFEVSIELYVSGCFSFCLYDVIINFLNNRTNIWIWRQAFASLQHGLLRSEENVLYNFEIPDGVWENVVSCNILTLCFFF